VAEKEDQHDAEQHQAQVDLLAMAAGGAEALHPRIAQIDNDAGVQDEEQRDGDDAGGEELRPHDVIADVLFSEAQRRGSHRGHLLSRYRIHFPNRKDD